MEYIIIFILLSIFTWLKFFKRESGRQKSGVATRLPPSPYPLPIIGNILELGDKLTTPLACCPVQNIRTFDFPEARYHNHDHSFVE
ncbi:hypothetical protein Hdeb2414_s0008g00272131 [Helianthus debilis subsp. tardiflorus]